jgi:hypothetical protein
MRGATTPLGQAPVGYVSLTRTSEQAWSQRLTPADRSDLRKLNLTYTGAAAVFLDGLPCSSRVVVTRVTRSGKTLIVRLVYTRAAIGVATCIRTSIPYVVIGVSRKTLGSPAPTRVEVRASARA